MNKLTLLSLGAGVQSSTLALMAARGEITPMPAAAIFADTLAEPASVYQWLDWLETQLPFPVIRVTQGNGLIEDALRIRERKDKTGHWVPSGVPHYSINSDGSHGHGPRQCTADFKIAPIMRKARQLMKEAGEKHINQWIGISLDEAHRMKPSRVKYATNLWPLIDRGMKRHDCLRWMEKNGFPVPPRSACVFCPYHSNGEWRRLRDHEPDEFQRAVQFERDYQQAKGATVWKKMFGVYLHPQRVPLDQVDLSTDVDNGQGVLWGNECEGMCGV
ncbi:hypothetical protein WJU23_05335 [Prosthecobacter sp. SYSU 5D2]|uniref:hypothetical protein n=1 Tax=Prosthecobacter sp. SYSU 5D2 TaxID=3134134 RepID=UPI0031FEC373